MTAPKAPPPPGSWAGCPVPRFPPGWVEEGGGGFPPPPWPGQMARETPAGRQSRWPASSPHRGHCPRSRQSPPPVPPHDPSNEADTGTGAPDPKWGTSPPGPLDSRPAALSLPGRWARSSLAWWKSGPLPFRRRSRSPRSPRRRGRVASPGLGPAGIAPLPEHQSPAPQRSGPGCPHRRRNIDTDLNLR